MSDPSQIELRSRIQAFLAADADREITEDGELLFELRRARFRLEHTHGKLLLHLWSAERNWVRRVLGIARETPDRMEIEVERFGQARPGRLAVAPPRRRRVRQTDRTAARRLYSAWLRRLLEREFPGARIEGLSTAPDLKRSFSALYTRARLGDRERWWAVMGVGAGEGSVAADGLLTYALIWLDWNRQRHPARHWAGLRLFVPSDFVRTTACRLPFLSVPVELYATDEDEFACRRVDPADSGNLDTHLPLARQEQDILAAESPAVARICALAPEDVEVVALPGKNELALRFCGLEFARSSGGRVSFGVGRAEKALGPRNFAQVTSLVKKLQRERRPDASPTSRLYRMQAERWLECLVRASPHVLDPRLLARPVYRQVPALAGGERGVVDLLGVRRDGRLVVIELKASADIHLLLQGLDYWICTRWYHQRGQLAARGYFPGVKLRPDPPHLLLAAPALQLHPAVEACLACLGPEVQVTLVGLNEDWRRGLKVVFRRAASGKGKGEAT